MPSHFSVGHCWVMALLSYGASLQNITAQSLMLLHVLFSACTFRLFFTRYQFSMNFQFSTAVEWAACVGYALRLCTVNMTASVWIFIFVCVHDYQYVCVFVWVTLYHASLHILLPALAIANQCLCKNICFSYFPHS